MEEGINLSVVLSGASLVGIIGIAVRVWISGKPQKIEQPLEVQPTICERQIKSNSADHENMFARLGGCEQRVSSLEANEKNSRASLSRIENKVDELLKKGPQ